SKGWAARLWWLWHNAWGFDIAYDRLLVRPYRGLVRLLRSDLIDRLLYLAAWLAWGLHRGLSLTQSGKLRLYATTMAAGVTLVLLVLVVGG
ncbi:MAG: NADH-quinone oxidoreductase subunit L, partial [Onishia taeanensis]